MIFGFDTDDEHAATAALIVYACYRSRDKARFKVTPDLWGQIERFAKDAAKRAKTIHDLIENLKRTGRMNAPTLHPKYLRVGLPGETPMAAFGGGFVQIAADHDAREFGVRVFEQADAKRVISEMYRHTAWVIQLVRDRLERERPIETIIEGNDE